MPKVLAFTQSSHKLTAPVMTEGLPEGLVLQLWVRRTGEAARQPIVALTAGAGAQIVLGSGDRADSLVFAVTEAGKTQELVVPGGLPEGRWVQVRAALFANGKSQLSVLGMTMVSRNLGAPGQAARTVTIGGGFVGELALLQIWRHSAPAKLSWAAPPLDAQRLWAYYPLEQATAADKQVVSVDASNSRRHAHGSSAPATVKHDEPLADGGGSYLRFNARSMPVNLSPLPCLERQVAFEAWVRPDNDEAAPAAAIGLQGGEGRVVLAVGGKDEEVALVIVGGETGTTLVRATGLVKRGQWSHVTAQIATIPEKSQFVVSVFHQGVLRKQETVAFASPTMGGWVGLAALMQAPLVKTVRLGGAAPTLATFQGGMAEARIWRTTAEARTGSMWLARARGDEPDLLACYRLDGVNSGRLGDTGPRRGAGSLPPSAKIDDQGGPPIAATAAARAFTLTCRGKLVRERLNVKPSTKPNNTKILLDVRPKDGNQADGERCIFDATIAVKAHSGASLAGRALEVRVDRPLTAVLARGESDSFAAWAAGTTHTVALPASGQLRLRFLADQLSCPTIRVRVAGAPGGLWTAIRPDEPAQAQLRSVTAETLKSPGDPRRNSPLPAGASDDDAGALAETLRLLGSQLHAGATTGTKPAQSRLFGVSWDDIEDTVDDAADVVVDTAEDVGDAVVDTAEDVGDAVVDAAEGVGDAVVETYEDVESAVNVAVTAVIDRTGEYTGAVTRAAKSASGLIVRGAAAVATLTARAGAVTFAGERALTQLIDSADQIAFIATSTAGGWLEVVGTTIVDGAEVGWRAVVSGVDEALTAVTAVVKRIGAAIAAFIEFLAFLFAWDDFLAASDEALAVLEAQMNGLGAAFAGLGDYKQSLLETLRTGVEEAIGKRSIGDLFGLDVDAASPVFEPIEQLMEYVGRAFDSTSLAFEGVTGMAAPKGTIDAGLAASAKQVNGLLSPITDVRAYLTTPVAQLVAGGGAVADGSASLLDALFDGVVDGAQAVAEQATKQCRARISVPWLTDMVETVILGGRKFTMARVVALVAGVLGVLTNKSAKQARSSATAKPSGAARTGGVAVRQKTAQEQADERTRWVVYVSTALGFVNSVFIIAKTVQEYGEEASPAKTNGTKFMTMMSALFVSLRGGFTLGRLEAYPANTRALSGVNAALEMVAGGWTFVSLVKNTGREVDMAMFGIIGLAMATTSATAIGIGSLTGEYEKVSFGLRCGSWLSNALVRLSEKSDDDDKTGKAKFVTGGLALLAIATDLTEAIYVNVNEAQSS